jgi:hypothetical protein
MPEFPFKSHPARAAAKAAGEKLYDAGRPCENGHHAMRYVGNGNCVDCMAANLWAASNDRPASEWRRKHAHYSDLGEKPDTARIVGDAWHERRKQETIERRENKPPMIGADHDDDAATPSLTARRLIKANGKFLKLLHVEALQAIRNGVSQHAGD